ncbi:hypothetical protein Tco_1248289, partial [Tanacetum coccineum]
IRYSRVDGPPVMPEDPYAYVVATFQAPPSPDYLSGPEYPLAPDFVPEPVYPEFMPPEDEVLPAEEQPLPAALSPTILLRIKTLRITYPLGYRATMIRLRAEAPSTSHSPQPHIILSHTRADTPPSGTPRLLPIPLPTSSASLLLHSLTHLGPAYSPRPTGGFRADYGFVATLDREIRRDLERDVGYGITDTWDEMLVDMLEAPATDDIELGRWMTEFATRVRQDTDEIYVRDRRAHAHTALLMEIEARMSREAWGRSMDASDLARSEVMSLRYYRLGLQAVIIELQAADRRRHAPITELLATDHRRQS